MTRLREGTHSHSPSRSWLWGALATLVLSSLASLPVTVPAMAHLGAPWGAADMTAYYFVESTWEWWRHGFTTDVAFPEGMDSNIYAGLDGLTHVLAHALSLVSGNAFVGLNLVLLLSFPGVALLAYAGMRLVGLGNPIAVALGSAFTFIPFHFGRGLSHVHLGFLIGATTGVVLALIVGSGRLTWWMEHGGRTRWAYVGVTSLLVVATAWTGLYYAFFGALLVAAAIVWRISEGDRWRELRASLATLAGLIVAMAVGLVSVLLSRASAPGTVDVGLRDPMDSVTYAGNLAISLIPQPYSVLSDQYNEFISNVFAAAPPNEAHLMANFGTWVTSVALVAMLVGLVTYRRRSRLTPAHFDGAHSRDQSGVADERRLDQRRSAPQAPISFVAYLGVVVLVAFVPWSVNYLFAYFFTAQIRAWNRLEPYLLLLMLLGGAAALASWRWPRRPFAAWAVSVIVVLTTVVEMVMPWRGVYTDVPAAGQQKIDSLRAYVDQVRSTIPAECGILTLPFIPYPNAGPRVGMDDYDHFLLTLVNPNNPISYGAYAGSPEAQRLEALSSHFDEASLWALGELGFCAIHVDKAGYEDPESVVASLRSRVGDPVAQEGRWVMFALPPSPTS